MPRLAADWACRTPSGFTHLAQHGCFSDPSLALLAASLQVSKWKLNVAFQRKEIWGWVKKNQPIREVSPPF